MAQAFIALDAAVPAHTEALARVGRAEGRFLAVRSRMDTSEDPDGSRRLRKRIPAPRGPRRPGKKLRARASGRLHPGGLGSSRFAYAVAEPREAYLAQPVREATESLLPAPVIYLGDIALKLAVIIAAGEPGPPDATAFPWSHLRRILAGIGGMADVDRGR